MKTILLILMLAFAPAFTGCKSSPNQIAYKAADAVVTSVDVAMSVWYDYVVSEEHRLSKLPAAERGTASADLLRKEGRVINAHARYLEAMRVSRAAVNATLAAKGPVPANVAAAAAEVLTAITEARK